MATELRWGIIGCGSISHDFARSLKNCKHRNKIVAAAARSAEKAQDFVREFGLDANAYDDYEKVLKDERVDVVYIGLLNYAHFEWILKALDAEKHVLCEKPMVINSNQMKQVIEKAKQKKKFIMEAVWSRFFPAWRKIREIIESKELGELKSVGANFGVQLPEDRFDLQKDASPLNDIGTYVVGLAIYAFDEEKPEKTQIVFDKNSNGADLWGNITLKFKAFENGIVELPQFFWCPERMIKTTGPLSEGKREEFDFSLADYDGYNFDHSAGLHYEADHVFEKIQEGCTESPIMSLANTQQIIEVLEDLRRQMGISYKND